MGPAAALTTGLSADRAVAPAAAAGSGGWSFACPDWFERLAAGRSLVPDLPLDRDEAERAVQIFNRLRLPDVPGQPANREAAGEWFRDIVRAGFGSLDRATGRRMVPELFLLVPKKNNKTTGGAHVALTAMLMNRRPYAELLFIGPTQIVSDTAFEQAAGTIASDPEGYLQKRFQIRDHVKTIVDRTNKARLKIKTFDMKVITGSKPVFVLIDELHVMDTIHYAAKVLRQIRGGLMPNPESMLVFITTQSDDPPAGVFKDELDYARGVRDGRITVGARMLPVLYEFPATMQTAPDRPWEDPRNWPLVNPNLGRSLALEDLVAGWRQAHEKGEAHWRGWASQHLNVQIGVAIGGWRGADYWQQAADESLTLDELLERSEVATVGIDGGGLDDLLGLAVLGRCKTTQDWLLWTRAWAHPDVIERRGNIAQRLRDFEADGDLVLCQRPTQDVEEVAAIVARVAEAGLLPERHGVGLDPVGVAAIVDALDACGLGSEENKGPLCAVPQGYRLNSAVLGIERKLKDGTLWHGGQALMRWCVGNAKTELRGSAVMITKQAAGRAKIDPLIAAMNAFVLMSRAPAATKSVYRERGLVMV
ncbi:MAG TPA: terminase large subunit [Kiloniellales bacterium]